MLPWKQCPVDACVTKWTELNDCKFLLHSFLSVADTIQHMHYKNTARPYREQIYTMSYMLLTGKKYVQVHKNRNKFTFSPLAPSSESTLIGPRMAMISLRFSHRT